MDGGAKPAGVAPADLWGRSFVSEQRRAFAHRRAALGPQPDPAAWRAILKLSENFVGARKTADTRAALATAFLNRPFQRAFDRRGRGVDVVAIETKPCLAAAGVERAKP